MIPIIARNLIGTLILCGFWDWLLYFSPLKTKFHKLGFQKGYFCGILYAAYTSGMFFCETERKYKINSVYPSKYQIMHDASYTLFASFLASVIEIWLCHAWSIGWIPYESDGNIFKNVLIGSFVFLWRAPHFHLIHRLIHPWRTVYFPGTNLIFSIQSVD